MSSFRQLFSLRLLLVSMGGSVAQPGPDICFPSLLIGHTICLCVIHSTGGFPSIHPFRKHNTHLLPARSPLWPGLLLVHSPILCLGWQCFLFLFAFKHQTLLLSHLCQHQHCFYEKCPSSHSHLNLAPCLCTALGLECLKQNIKPNMLRGRGVLSVKDSLSLLPACQLISSRSGSLLLTATEITVERNFVPQHTVIIRKILDLTDVC